MKTKTKNKLQIIAAIVSILAGAIIIGHYLNFLAISPEFDGRLLGNGAENLYQYAINPEPGEKCSGIQSWITDKGYIFSDTSTIKTATSTFSFVTKDIIDVARSGDNMCGAHPYSVDVYKDGSLIDSVSYIDVLNYIHSGDTCSVPDYSNINSRAYSDDGQVYKKQGSDFMGYEKMTLPEGKSGIEVDFGTQIWQSGYKNYGCFQNNVMHSYNVVYPKSTVSVDVKNFAVNNSNLVFDVDTNTAMSGLIGDIVVYNNPGVGGEVELYRLKSIDLSQGIKDNMIIIPLNSDNVNLNLRVVVEPYHTTADLINLNGVLIFSSTVPRYFGSDSNSKYRIGIFGNETFALSIVDGIIQGQNQTICPIGQTRCSDGTCKTSCVEPCTNCCPTGQVKCSDGTCKEYCNKPINWVLIGSVIGIAFVLFVIVRIAWILIRRKR